MMCFGFLVMWCQPSLPAPAPTAFCEIARPIYWSPQDTRKTKEQVDSANRVWKELCKGK